MGINPAVPISYVRVPFYFNQTLGSAILTIIYIYKDFFHCGPFFKSLLNFLTVFFLFFHVLLFWP